MASALASQRGASPLQGTVRIAGEDALGFCEVVAERSAETQTDDSFIRSITEAGARGAQPWAAPERVLPFANEKAPPPQPQSPVEPCESESEDESEPLLVPSSTPAAPAAAPHTWADTGKEVAGAVASGAVTVVGFVVSAAVQISTGTAVGATVGGVTGAIGGFAASTANVATSLALSTAKVGVQGVVALGSAAYSAAKNTFTTAPVPFEPEKIRKKPKTRSKGTDAMPNDALPTGSALSALLSTPTGSSMYHFPELLALGLSQSQSQGPGWSPSMAPSAPPAHVVTRMSASMAPSAPPMDDEANELVQESLVRGAASNAQLPPPSGPLSGMSASPTPALKPTASACVGCEKPFGFKTWRFQCPLCEETFCGECLSSETKHIVPARNITEPAALCKRCFFSTCSITCGGKCFENFPQPSLCAFVEREKIRHGAVARVDLLRAIHTWARLNTILKPQPG